jgi:hypothetical protein
VRIAGGAALISRRCLYFDCTESYTAGDLPQPVFAGLKAKG